MRRAASSLGARLVSATLGVVAAGAFTSLTWAASVVAPVETAGDAAPSSPGGAPAERVATEAAAVRAGLAAGASATVADPLDVDPAEPDFTVINLPTTARLPRHKASFRLTHRFSRGLERGDFGDLVGDLFGFDGGAQVGLELRYGVTGDTQLGLQRTSDRTLEVFVQQGLLHEDGAPIGLALALSLEGRDNLGEDYSPRVALVASKRLGERSAVYVQPAFVGNTRLGPDAPGDDATFVLGLGARVGLGAGVALLGEVTPRLAGYDGGPNSATHLTFGIEKRVGGHAFQLNVSNDLGTTPAQVARGRQGRDDWFIGFNLSRKFY